MNLVKNVTWLIPVLLVAWVVPLADSELVQTVSISILILEVRQDSCPIAQHISIILKVTLIAALAKIAISDCLAAAHIARLRMFRICLTADQASFQWNLWILALLMDAMILTLFTSIASTICALTLKTQTKSSSTLEIAVSVTTLS